MTEYEKGAMEAIRRVQFKLEISLTSTKEKIGEARTHHQYTDAFFAVKRAYELALKQVQEVEAEMAPKPVKPSFVRSESGLYRVKQYDGMDNNWIKLHTKPFREADAIEYWLRMTKGGTMNTEYADIDYYAIFPVEDKR